MKKLKYVFVGAFCLMTSLMSCTDEAIRPQGGDDDDPIEIPPPPIPPTPPGTGG